MLTPVAVKTALQRQHISKELIEYGLPSPECLMVKELENGALQNIKGTVDYSYYQFLT